MYKFSIPLFLSLRSSTEIPLELLTMSSPFVSERSPLEASRESLEYILRNTPFEVCKKVDEVSSTSLGSKRNDAKLGKENAVPSSLKWCLFCKQTGHTDSVCLAILRAQAAVDPPLPECEMCRGEHGVVQCPALQQYRPPLKRFDEEGKIIYIKDGVTYRKRPKMSEYLAPHTCNHCYRVHTSLCPRCPICYKEHMDLACCPYNSCVPKDAIVSPYYDMMCWNCESEVDSSLQCSRCHDEGKVCVNNRLGCIVCGKPSSEICCPYGKHIAEKFRESHPQLQSKFI